MQNGLEVNVVARRTHLQGRGYKCLHRCSLNMLPGPHRKRTRTLLPNLFLLLGGVIYIFSDAC